jgi:DNA-binding IclR family transcriptional regulator
MKSVKAAGPSNAGTVPIAVPLVRFDGKAVAALNIGVQPEQVWTKAMIADYVPLLVKEATALRRPSAKVLALNSSVWPSGGDCRT